MTKTTQLRGQALLIAIESALRQLASEKEDYIYNESELSRRVGCSRPTLDKKSEFIDEVLKQIGAEKRIKKDHPLVEHLYTRIDKLESEKEDLKKELNALRSDHANIYTTLHRHSADMSFLIKPIVANESSNKGKCILCGGDLVEAKKAAQKENKVVSLANHKK